MLEDVYDCATDCGFHILNMGSDNIEIAGNPTHKISIYLSVYRREVDKYECVGNISWGEGRKLLKSEMINIDTEVKSEKDVVSLINDIAHTVRAIDAFVKSQQELF